MQALEAYGYHQLQWALAATNVETMNAASDSVQQLDHITRTLNTLYTKW